MAALRADIYCYRVLAGLQCPVCSSSVYHLNNKLFIFTGAQFHPLHYLCWRDRERLQLAESGYGIPDVCQVIQNPLSLFQKWFLFTAQSLAFTWFAQCTRSQQQMVRLDDWRGEGE